MTSNDFYGRNPLLVEGLLTNVYFMYRVLKNVFKCLNVQ